MTRPRDLILNLIVGALILVCLAVLVMVAAIALSVMTP